MAIIIEKSNSSYTSPTTRPLYRGTQIVWYIVGIVEGLLLFRFLLRLLAANPSAGFSQFIYGITYPFVAPFMAVFPNNYASGSVLEWTTLLAMLVYWLLALAVIKLFLMSRTVSTPEAAAKLENEEQL